MKVKYFAFGLRLLGVLLIGGSALADPVDECMSDVQDLVWSCDRSFAGADEYVQPSSRFVTCFAISASGLEYRAFGTDPNKVQFRAMRSCQVASRGCYPAGCHD